MAAPELRLEVSLNLAGFRNEVRKLTQIAQSEFVPKINVKFNRQTLDAELNNLQRAIKRRVYRVEIGGNIDSLPGKIKALKEQLASIESLKIDLGIGAVKSLSKKDASKIKSDLRAEILGEQKKLYIPTSIQAKISRDDVRNFKNAVKSKLTGLSVDVKVNAKGGGFAGSEQGAAGLMQYMRSQGMVGKTASGMEMRLGKGGDDIKQQLSDAVQSAEKIKSVFDGVAKNIATTGKSIANVQGKRLSLANVPLIAGSVEKKVERSAEAIGGTMSPDALKALYPEINKTIASFASLKGQIQQNTSKLSGFSLIIGLAAFAGVPLAKSIVKLTGSTDNFAKLLDKLGPKLEAAFAKATSGILNNASSRLLSGGRPAGLLPAAYRGIGPSAEPAGLLPPAYRGIGPSRNAGSLPGTAFGGQKYLPTALGEELKEVLRGAANAFLDSIRQNIRAVTVTDMGAPPSRQGLLQGGSVAGFLPGRASAASVLELNNILAGAIREYFKLVAREIEYRSGSIGKTPLSTTPLLEPSRIAGLLPGRPSAASVLELNNILAGAIREYFKAVARDVAGAGRAPIATTPLLSAASPRNQLMLPPAGGTTANLNRPRTTTGSFTGRGYEPPGGFASDGMLGGRQGPATFIGAGSQMEKFKTVPDVATASTQNFRASQIPLIGGIKSLAGEFGEATKQVLLYGTAYKGLAFLISLPGQVLNAAKSQQQFNNGLKVATQETGTFAKELLYVDNVQRAFGLNLETTRTGFTRLYASMAPTGFDSGSIEKLFTGISAATASLQLTPDKAERVIYAFGQMASKGQIMAEELKGQLGDVLPGALAIFSRAAGMSVKEFSKAMEDGEFTGNRFREVFAKVSDELMNRFGTGAQVAGRSLQGLINTVGGDFQRTLESFAPLANAAAQATLGPLTGMLREVSMAAQIAMGEQDRVRKQLEAAQTDVSTLKAGGADAKEIKAAEQNVAALAAKYEVLNEAARDPAIARQVKNIEAFVAEVQKAATFTMNFAGVIGSVLSPLFTILGGNLTSVIGNLALLVLGFNAAKLAALLMMGVMNTMNAIQGITATGAAGTTVLAGAFRLLGTQATGAQVATVGFGVAIKGLLISTGIGAVVVLLGSLAAAFLSVGNKAKEAADRAKRSIDSMADAARTGNVSLIEMELSVNKADRQDVENLIKSVEQLKGRTGGKGVQLITLTPELKREAKRLGVEVAGEVSKGSVLRSLKILRKPLQEAAAEGVQDLAAARKRAEALGMNKPDPSAAAAGEEAAGTGKPPKEQSLESYYSLQDQLAKNATDFAAAQTEEEFRHKIELLEMYYDIQETRANAYQKDAIRFEREMVMIEERRQEARLKAQLEVQRAQGSVAGGAGGGGEAGSGGKGLGAGIAQYITGDPSSPFYKADHGGGNYHEHLAFVSRQAAEEAYKKLTSAGIQVTEFKGKSRVGRHTPGSAHYEGLAFDVPGAQVPVGRERELTARVQSTLGIGGARPTPVPASQKRDAVAEQNTLQASIAETATKRRTDVKAVEEQIVAFEKYRAAAFPTVEQEIQNKLLLKRNELFRSGMTDERIDQEIKLYENQERGAAGLAAVNRLLAKKIINDAQAAAMTKELNKDIAAQNILLQQNATAMAQAKFDQTMKGIRDQVEMARSITPDQEMRTQIAQEGYVGNQAESIFQERKTLQGAQKLKEDMQGIASSIGNSFGEAFKGIITGSMTAQEALAGMFQSIADHFADMVAQMIAEWLKAQLIKGFMSILGMLVPGGGGVGGGLGSMDANIAQYAPLPAGYANGGIAPGGFTAFANGGMVTGPTMGLVGEGRYNEAIVPLPDGKSIPVELAGGGSSSPTVIVNVDAKGSQVEGNEQNANQLGRVISAAVQTELIKQQRPGGLLAR